MDDLNIDRVRAILHAKFGGRGIDVDKVYINGVHTLEDQLVTYSQTLVWAFLLRLQDGEVPNFEGEQLGIFSHAYTFDPDLRFKGLEFDEINGLGAEMATLFLADPII
ncbi:hypothetical protein NYP20_04830 [Pseudomonas sp. N3-W]|jgi:hypothetical protein|uniref:hypothetical protein n=1 Tax=Pseudomonas sp. N3-W TaxID=2975049 RepID=UPI00217D35AF|nr:hypothetical protein [Pseudomonas sp. N3-W]UWF50294.1 hypothetical protein NYP20_04830 [Pseudomonas sp. N3-W]